jgi:SAM-dependent methyltransferase
MNHTELKNYARQARRDFIQAVTDRAAFYGVTAAKIESVTVKGDVAIIVGHAFPASVVSKRKTLVERIDRCGFNQTMEALAYTWFNRFVAIRFMELHGYLEHGYRVLSHPDPTKAVPEILELAEHVDLPGLSQDKVIDLKLDGNKEAELYQTLLLAQCHALHSAMPFLFEWIGDDTELVLPDNLLHSDSIIRKLVNQTREDDWQQVEIIGWLYQFYISEKKEEVIGKEVASADIPAATQLFTPNWIVKYLVQNTLGRQWLATYPQSTLRQQMEYYIEPVEQTSEVQEQLKAITPTSLNPEELTLLDPACGSGHILVEAYDLFKAIYQERGYRGKEIPISILQKNLFGLEIDDRAAQLAAFALMMKARADDPHIFDSEAKPNILAFEDSQRMDAADITNALNSPINREDVASEYLFEEIQEEKDGLFSKKALAEKSHVSQADIACLLELFENAKTYGSLIRVSETLKPKLPEIEKRLDNVLKHGDLTHAPAHVIKSLLQAARLLVRQYDSVVANPPYMGGKYFVGMLKDFVADQFKEAKADLYGCFIQRNIQFVKPNGFVGMITIPNWMFLPSFEDLRKGLLNRQTIDSLIHNGRGVWGSDFGSCNFVIRNTSIPAFEGTYRRLFDKQGSVASNEELEERFHTATNYPGSSNDFKPLPGSPLAYWLSDRIRMIFAQSVFLGTLAEPRQGMATADNERFLRRWFEVAIDTIGFALSNRVSAKASGKTWFPYNKGGAFRRWYGNNEFVVNWKNDGEALFAFKPRAVIRNPEYYFRQGITWTMTSSVYFGVRHSDPGFLFDVKGSSCFAPPGLHNYVLGFLATKIVKHLIDATNPTTENQIGNLANLPVLASHIHSEQSRELVSTVVEECVEIARSDWNSLETSWDFKVHPLLLLDRVNSLEDCWKRWLTQCEQRIARLKELEEANNRIFLEAYRLQEELTPDVPDEQITLYRPSQEEDTKRVLSYAIGCIMGRYSVDKQGLIYAHGGNQDFEASQYKTFRAGHDGIIPLLEADWGIRDDATTSIVEFVGGAWPKEHLEENLKFIADSLGPTSNEQPRDTIRRYFATGFYKHHLSTYKKRPIYWLFSSGKERAFQALVYLHRYHEGTLSRMRTEYVIPLQGKIASRIDQFADDIQKATSTSHRKKMEKERDRLLRQRTELQTFDEKLRHYADQRIQLDLDDGVKVNYGKFGDLLAEVKAITGGSDE